MVARRALVRSRREAVLLECCDRTKGVEVFFASPGKQRGLNPSILTGAVLFWNGVACA